MKKQIFLLASLLLLITFSRAQNTFPATGFVGIGTLNPAQSLDVVGNVAIRAGSLIFNNTEVGPRFELSGNGQFLHLGGLGLLARNDGVQDLGSAANPFRQLWLAGEAYVGKNVYINTRNANGLIVDSTGLQRVGLMKYSGKAAGIWRVENQEFEMGRVNVNQLPGTPSVYNTDFYIAGDGNIGIGTKKPSQKLSVNGEVLAKKVKVSVAAEDWPDYVFDSTYQLMPLHRLEQYVRKNKHLPEVPPANEIEKNGIDAGEHAALMLKKIEELTLYVIQQKNQLQNEMKEADLKKAKLEKRLAELEALLKAR